MDFLKTFLVQNYGLVGMFIFILLVAIIFMAKYIIKTHRQERNEWREERKEFRQSLDKNSQAIQLNSNLVGELSTILKTINKMS